MPRRPRVVHRLELNRHPRVYISRPLVVNPIGVSVCGRGRGVTTAPSMIGGAVYIGIGALVLVIIIVILLIILL